MDVDLELPGREVQLQASVNHHRPVTSWRELCVILGIACNAGAPGKIYDKIIHRGKGLLLTRPINAISAIETANNTQGIDFGGVLNGPDKAREL